MSWIDEQEKVNEERRSEGFFSFVEGDNRFQLLTHCVPIAQVWDTVEKKYRIAEEGDRSISIKGVCWVLQDGKIKQAKLPYTVLKAVRELQNDPDYAFTEFPMPRAINVRVRNVATKEVEYSVIPSPKVVVVGAEILEELKSKLTPEEMVERLKDSPKVAQGQPLKYPEGPHLEDIPF